MKTRYYRHKDPRRGFQLCQQLQIPSQQKLLFKPDIQKLNQMYRECADKHTQCFLEQPNQNKTLQKLSMLLLLPLLISFSIDDFSRLVELYLFSIFGIIYFIFQYMNKLNECRSKFNQANVTLRQQFYKIQNKFQQKWPYHQMILMRQWNQFNQTCVEYIQICPKQGITKQNQQQENFSKLKILHNQSEVTQSIQKIV